MALDPEERKIAALFAAFEDINARVDGTVGRLERIVGSLDPSVRQTVRDACARELAELTGQINMTTSSLERLRRSADWRQLLVGAGLSALVVLVTLFGFWLSTPSAAELTRLRAERDELQGAVDRLAERGGRAPIMKCGAGDEHLCVRVDPTLGRHGEGKDYYVIRGY
jgi:hypothetical protein